jgi:hypothetical protein
MPVTDSEPIIALSLPRKQLAPVFDTFEVSIAGDWKPILLNMFIPGLYGHL